MNFNLIQELAGIDGARDLTAMPPNGSSQEIQPPTKDNDGQVEFNPDVKDTIDSNHHTMDNVLPEVTTALNRLLLALGQDTQENDLKVQAELLLAALNGRDVAPPPETAPPGSGPSKNLNPDATGG